MHPAATYGGMEKKEEPRRIAEVEVIPPEKKAALPQETDAFTLGLTTFLDARGLPSENVLVPIDERRKLFRNLDDALQQLAGTSREDAYYVSKFVASSAVGLFDAALNYVSNETILALRRRVADFDLNYFFDSVFSGSKTRDQYSSEDDLKKIEDWQFINGCKQTGIISEHAFFKLDHIREMRNFASAAHPNQAELTGLELAGYLESCINHVLSRPPEEGAINNRLLLRSLRAGALAEKDAEPIRVQIAKLPVPYANILLRAMLGMYVDPAIAPQIRTNIDLVVTSCWARADEQTRRNAGLQYGKFSANAEMEKKKLARAFLEKVDGLTYLTDDMRAIEIKERAEALWNAHVAWNNFYNEEPHAESLARMTVAGATVPEVARPDFVRIVTRCYMGNGYGVATAAVPAFNRMIDAWSAAEIIDYARLAGTSDMKRVFSDKGQAERYKKIAGRLLQRAQANDVTTILKAIDNSSTSELEVGRAWLNIKDTVERARY